MMARVRDRKVDNGLKGQQRRQPVQAFLAGKAGDLLLQRLGYEIGLAGAIHREGIIFERIELGHDAKPCGLRKGGKYRGQASQSSEARKSRDADHRRDEHEPVRPRQSLILKGIERIFQREGAAVGKTDDVQGERWANTPPRLPDREPRRRHPVFPGDAGQGARNGAMRWQSDRDRDKPMFAIAPGDMAQTIGRVGEPM